MQGMLEQKMQSQHEELQSLLAANQRLAATHVALRQELAAAQQEMQRLNSVIAGVSSEKDAQIRSLIEKAGKLESELRSTEPIKQELIQVRGDCQKLHLHSQELNQQLRNATQEVQRARGELQQVPALRTEVDNLRAELQRARNAFEYEKKANADQLEQRQVMEKNLVEMARDIEKLRAEAANVDKRPRVHPGGAYNGGYPVPEGSYGVMQPQVYGDGYGMHPQEAGPAANGNHSTNASENDYGKSLVEAAKANLEQVYPAQAQDPSVKATADVKASEEWATHEAPNGKPFYYNLITGVTQWEKPAALESQNYPQAHMQAGTNQPSSQVYSGQVQHMPHVAGGVVQASQQPNTAGQVITQTPQMAPGHHPGGYVSHMGASYQQPGMYGQPPGSYMGQTGTYMYGGSHMPQPGAYVQPSGMAQFPAGQPPQPAGHMQTPQGAYALPAHGQPAGATAPAPMPHLVHGHLSYPAPGAGPHPGPPQALGAQLPPLMPVPLGQPPILQSPQTQSNQTASRPGGYSSNIQQQQQGQQTSSQPSPRQAQNQPRASSQLSPSPSTPSQAQGQATNGQTGHTPHVSAPPVIHQRPPVSETTTPAKATPAPPPPTATSGPQGANLFVFGIPEDLGDKKLADLFTPYGTVIYSKIGVEKDTGRNRTYGFVSMDSPQSAEAAIQQVNGLLISGKRIKVELKRGDNEGQTHQQQNQSNSHPHQHQPPSGPGPTRWNASHNANSGYRPY
jgi:hypothetical protein